MIYRKNQSKKYTQFERQIQTSIFDWARIVKVKEGGYLFDFMTASANGGSRNVLEARNLKRSGVSAGFPDISILMPRGQFHGMFLEVKKEKNYAFSDKQKSWLDRLNKVGYYANVGFGFDECKSLIESYLSLESKYEGVLPDNRI